MAMATSQVSRIATITQLKTSADTSLKMNQQIAPKLPEKRTKFSKKIAKDDVSIPQTTKPQAAPRTRVKKFTPKPFTVQTEQENATERKQLTKELTDPITTVTNKKTDSPTPGVSIKCTNIDSLLNTTHPSDQKETISEHSANSTVLPAPEQNALEVDSKSAKCNDQSSSSTRSPSPPFSPPSPHKAMLQVSSALQKVSYHFRIFLFRKSFCVSSVLSQCTSFLV